MTCRENQAGPFGRIVPDQTGESEVKGSIIVRMLQGLLNFKIFIVIVSVPKPRIFECDGCLYELLISILLFLALLKLLFHIII